jgi:hypothetical protein
MRTTNLDVAKLEKVSGGRGSFCGAVLHCDNCGYVGQCGASSGGGAMAINIYCTRCYSSMFY